MIVTAEFSMNRHESFRAEISESAGLLVVSIGRFKIRPDGTTRRAGPALEFAAHRLEGVIELLANVQRIVEAHEICADKQSASA
jgi:hypothetical protein